MEKITLKYPIGDLKEITVRRPKVKDLLNIEQLNSSDSEKELLLIELLTGVSKDTLRELDIYDYSQLQRVYANFLKG